jgi:hypothetical protein
MKNKSSLQVCILTIVVLSSILYACKKQKGELNPTGFSGDPLALAVPYTPVDNFDINYLTNPISIAVTSPNLLVFSTKSSFEYTRGELETLNGLFEVPDTLQDSVSFDPILEKFEDKFAGYRSLRQDIEAEIDSLCDANVFDPSIYDPDDHFIGDVYFRTVLNELMEVQINETVYKVMSKNWVATFSSGDMSKLTFLRGYSVGNLNGRIKDTMVNGILLTYTGGEYDIDPATGSQKRAANGSCPISLSFTESSGGSITISGVGAPSCGLGLIQFNFGDGSPVQTQSTVGFPGVTHVYSKNGKYLVKVEYGCGCGPSSIFFIEVTVTTAASSPSCGSFPTADFTVDLTEAGVLKANSTVTNSLYRYHWVQTSPFIENLDHTQQEFILNFLVETTVEVCLKIYNSDGCVSTKCSTVTVPNGCCQRGHTQEKQTFEYATDHKMKCKIFRWNGGPLGRNVGAKTVNFEKRKRRFALSKNASKHWRRTNVQIAVILNGKIWSGNAAQEEDRENGGPCFQKFDVSKSESKSSKKNADVTYNPGPLISDNHRVYTKKNKLNSTHTVNWNGNVYTVNMALTKCD